MKKIAHLVPIVAVAVLSALLLAGCQLGKHEKDKALSVEQTQVSVDTTEEDTMAACYERVQCWKILFECTSRWESEK